MECGYGKKTRTRMCIGLICGVTLHTQETQEKVCCDSNLGPIKPLILANTITNPVDLWKIANLDLFCKTFS